MDKVNFRKGLFYSLSVLSVLFLFSWVYGFFLTPIILSIFFSFILNPLVDRLEIYKIPRPVASIVLLVITFALLSLVAVVFLPTVSLEVIRVIKLTPSALDVVSTKWIPSIEEFIVSKGFVSAEDLREVVSKINFQSHISLKIYQALNTVWQAVPKVFTSFFSVLLVIFLTYFMVNNFYYLLNIVRKSVPFQLRTTTSLLSSKITQTLTTLIKGQALVAFIMGCGYVLGFSLMGLQSAFVIGAVAGVCRIVPYLDIIVGGSLSLIIAVYNFSDWTQIISIFVLFAVIQSIDGLFLTPKILGSRVGLHPMVVILSVLSFGSAFGFWGVVLAVPVISVLKILIEVFYPIYQRSDFFQKK
jgi:predicted PurR-regulated permease PerM